VEVLTVVWSTGSCDDHGSAHSFAGVHGTYKSDESAKRGLEECKNEIYEDVLNDLDPDNEFSDIRDEVKVYGSVEDGYFEIDYTIGTDPVEAYIGIVHGYVQD
jgi:hypothetical protein